MKPVVDVKVLDPRLHDNLPDYATPGSAGLDLGLPSTRTC
jgi:dUTP pyrophosphatase